MYCNLMVEVYLFLEVLDIDRLNSWGNLEGRKWLVFDLFLKVLTGVIRFLARTKDKEVSDEISMGSLTI